MTKSERCVLVVEKDVHLRRLLTDFLADLGYTTQFFEDGYSALDEARRNPPPLLISEIMIPRLDGLALCRIVKNDPDLAPTKVVILTILAQEEEARRSGADAYIHKPIERGSLAAAIRSLVGSNPAEGSK